MRESGIGTVTGPRDVADAVKVADAASLSKAVRVSELKAVTVDEPVRREQRAAILASLYEERQRLNKARRLGQASANDLEYLNDLDEYIAQWERVEVRVAKERDGEIWSRLDNIAAELVGLKASAKYEK